MHSTATNTDISSHYFKAHPDTVRPLMFDKKKLIIESGNFDAYTLILNIVYDNPQFALIYSNEAQSIDGPDDVSQKIKYDYQAAFEDCLKSPLRVYCCRLCGEEYDSLPSLKVARKHIRQCNIEHTFAG